MLMLKILVWVPTRKSLLDIADIAESDGETNFAESIRHQADMMEESEESEESMGEEVKPPYFEDPSYQAQMYLG